VEGCPVAGEEAAVDPGYQEDHLESNGERHNDGQSARNPGATSLKTLRVEPAERPACEQGHEEDQRRELERTAER
jgi:hypothetical protein